MLAIVDYGVGNLFSLSASLTHLGVDNRVTADADEIRRADRVILPGVGAFGDAARRLRDGGSWNTVLGVAADGKPLLGICLVMQLLFERSFEFGEHQGLALLPGEIMPLSDVLDPSLKVPHMGWNALKLVGSAPLLARTRPGDFMYFVHGYYAVHCADALLATASYGVDIPAVVGENNVFGCQFHPEKSGARAGIAAGLCGMEGSSC